MNFVWARSLCWIMVGEGRSDVTGGEARPCAVVYFYCQKCSVNDRLYTRSFLAIFNELTDLYMFMKALAF